MNTCTALVPIHKLSANGLLQFRHALRNHSATELTPTLSPRFELEALEPRRLLSGQTSAMIVKVDFPGWSGTASPANIIVAPDGKIYLASNVQATDSNGNWLERWGLARLNPDGTPDTTFGNNGSGGEVISFDSDAYPSQMLLQPDGKLIVMGDSANGLSIARFNTDGSLDTTYNGGIQTYDTFSGFDDSLFWQRESAWLTKDGKVMVAGDSGNGIITMRFNTDGTPDESYGPGGVVQATLDAVPNTDPSLGALLGVWLNDDGTSVMYADVWTQNPDGSEAPTMVRAELNVAGQLVSQKPLDVALNAGDGDAVYDYYIGFAPDGGVYVSDLVDDPRIERLTPAGDADPTFGDNGIITLPGKYAVIASDTSDGGLVVQYGNETTLDEFNEDVLVKVNRDGTLGTGYNDNQPPLGGGSRLGMGLSDGSILLGASASAADGTPEMQFERFLPDGTAADSMVDPNATPLDTPAAFAAVQHSQSAAGTANGLFAATAGATLFDPNGDQQVFA